ncbi:MAG: hypothetical protein EP344_04010 [Bacteroidetes bacterium]|nr:MAG: hypothetical protein EP344_04010 [Bacteroidota bacterium]
MKIRLLLALILPAIILQAQNTQSPPDTIRQHWHRGAKLAPAEKLVLLQITVLDLIKRRIPDLSVRVLQTPTGQVWQGFTGQYGEVWFLVPYDSEYRIDAGDEENITTFREPKETYLRDAVTITHLAKAYTEEMRNDTVFQQVSVAQTPTRERVLLQATILDLDDRPIPGEVLYFTDTLAGKVYVATTNERGRAALMLPKGTQYCFSTQFYTNLKCYEIPDNNMAGQLNIKFNTIGTQALLAREAERKRQAAIRDSLYHLARMRDSLMALNRQPGEYAFLHQFSFGTPLDSVKAGIERRSARERESIKKDPIYFEKTGEVVKATLYRMRDRWKNKVIVTDLTGSMSPYMDQVVLWHALQLVQGEENRYVFFNDGDHTPDDEKRIGQTGGIYFTEKADIEKLLLKMRETADGGNGGDGPENDLEALIEGTEKMQGLDELVLVADNFSDVRDMKLLINLKVPVHIVLCGTDFGVNENYLEIAYKTGGTIHTIEQDIDDLAEMADGATIRIGAYEYRVSRGKFIQVSKI